MNKTMTHFIFCAVFIVLNVVVQHVALNLLIDKYALNLLEPNNGWFHLGWFAVLYLLLAQMVEKHVKQASILVFVAVAAASSIALPIIHNTPMHQMYIGVINVLTAVIGFAAFKFLHYIDAKKSDLNT